MASFKKRYESKKKKDAISLLKSFIQKITTGEVDVEEFGSWSGSPGKMNLKLTVKESENSRQNPKF